MKVIKPYRQAVMAIFLKDDNSFLIGSSPRDGGYKFPQGGLKEGEDKKSGLFRELLEELGTNLTDDDEIELLPESFKYPYPETKPYSKKYDGQELHIFVVKFRKGMTFIPQDNEFDVLHWITIEHMHKFDFMHRKEAYCKAIQHVVST